MHPNVGGNGNKPGLRGPGVLSLLLNYLSIKITRVCRLGLHVILKSNRHQRAFWGRHVLEQVAGPSNLTVTALN